MRRVPLRRSRYPCLLRIFAFATRSFLGPSFLERASDKCVSSTRWPETNTKSWGRASLENLDAGGAFQSARDVADQVVTCTGRL